MSAFKISHFAESKIFRGGLLILLSSIINRLIVYALIPLYTQNMTPSEYGLMGYYQAFLLLLQTLVGLGLYGVQTRLYHDYKHDSKALGVFLFNINFLVVAFGLLLAMTNSVLVELFGIEKIHSESEQKIIQLLPWIALVQILNTNNNSFRIVRQEFKSLFVQKVIEAVLIASAISYFLLIQKNGALADFQGTLWGSLACAMIFFPKYASHFIGKINFNQIRTSLALGIPLIFHSFSNILTNIGDRFIIKHYLDDANLGIYTLGYQIGQIMSVVATSVNQAWLAHFIKEMTEEKPYQPNREFLMITGINTLLAVMLVLLVEFGAVYFIDISYIGIKQIAPIIIFSYLLNVFYFSGSCVLILEKKNSFLATVTVGTLVFNFLLNILIVPVYGIMGAAVVTGLSIAIRSVATIYVAQKVRSSVFLYTKAVFIVFLGLVSIVFITCLHHWLVGLGVFVFFMLFLVFLFKREFYGPPTE